MLNNLPHTKPDTLWALLKQYNEDKRPEKIDLLIGVYRDETGQTPVLEVVKQAEQEIAEQAVSKAYKQLSGNPEFTAHIAEYLLGKNKYLSTSKADEHAIEKHCTIQTVGGSGALRVLADFIAILAPDATVWNTDPGYINHQPIMQAAGLNVEPFRWQQHNGELDLQVCFFDLTNAKPGDIILLHGCCHNPTGIDPSFEQWKQFAELCKSKQLVPLIDMAYQGFGDDPEKDAKGLRLFVNELDLVLIAASCSKNMGLYCERIGAASIVTNDTEQLSTIRVTLENITRKLYSMPPEHGASIAVSLFNNADSWLSELSLCRQRVFGIRKQLGDTFQEIGAPEGLHSIVQQKGMFSMLPLDEEQMNTLREKYAIYGTENGRVNLAGLQQSQIRSLATALVEILN